MDRRRLVKWLIVVAIVVPLVVEGITLFGLVSSHFGDDDGGEQTPTGPGPVGVGDELLTETPARETLTAAAVDDGERWTLTLTVAVNNTGETAYELRLESVRAGDRRIEGSTSTGRIPPGGDGTVTGRWSLPAGTLPDAVSVTAVRYDGDGDVAQTVQREVPLETIRVRG